MFGELALLYDAPRSATVTCVEKGTLWSLERTLFKYIQAVSASAQNIQRSGWLTTSPDLKQLTPLDLSRLVSTMQICLFEAGDLLYTQGKGTKKCILIEKGSAAVYLPDSIKFDDKAVADKALNIVRPVNRRQSINCMTAKQLSRFMSGDDGNDDDSNLFQVELFFKNFFFVFVIAYLYDCCVNRHRILQRTKTYLECIKCARYMKAVF